MNAEQEAYRVGMTATKVTLARWNRSPWRTVRGWVALSALISSMMLVGVWLVSMIVPADSTPVSIPGAGGGLGLREVGWVFFNNLVVLALHATACVAGFIAGNSMPAIAAERTGFQRSLHLNAGKIAIAMVVLITGFSLVTQTYALGLQGAALADQLEISQFILILTVIPHALPELTALFLPLAAWTIASRRGQWDELLAATVVTVSLALPVLVVASFVEVDLWPVLLEAASPVL